MNAQPDEAPLAISHMKLALALRGQPLRLRLGELRNSDITIRYGDQGTIRITRGERAYDFTLLDVVSIARLAKFSSNPLDDEAAVRELGRTPEQLARKTDLATSKQVARIISGDLNALQNRVLEAFKHAGSRGLTDFELDEVCGGRGGSTYRTRRTELTRAGKIANSGSVRVVPGAGPHKRTVWVLAG